MSEVTSIFASIVEQFSVYTKEGLENLSSSTIVIFSLLYIHIFLYDVNSLSNYMGVLFYPILLLIIYILKIVIFSNDYLLYGNENNKYVKAFKSKLPSTYLMEKYEITGEKSNYYWFNIFNSWQNKEHNRYTQTQRTFRRGYACRFVYHSIMAFNILISVSIGTMLLIFGYIYYRTHTLFLFDSSAYMFGYILLLLILRLMISYFNSHEIGHMTGVWKKFESINQNHIEWLEDNIKSIKELEEYNTK